MSSTQNSKNDETKCFSSHTSFYPVHSCSGRALEVYKEVELLRLNIDRTTGQFDTGVFAVSFSLLRKKCTKIRDKYKSSLKRWPIRWKVLKTFVNIMGDIRRRTRVINTLLSERGRKRTWRKYDSQNHTCTNLHKSRRHKKELFTVHINSLPYSGSFQTSTGSNNVGSWRWIHTSLKFRDFELVEFWLQVYFWLVLVGRHKDKNNDSFEDIRGFSRCWLRR